MPENLYFLAVVPPKSIADEVEEFRQIMATRFKSKHALKSPPHITLIPPFWWEDHDYPKLRAGINEWLQSRVSIELILRDFNCFKPRVIYVDIEANSELNQMQSDLKAFLKEEWTLDPDKRPSFHPHLTIAFKDLKPRSFYRAWDYFKQQKYEARFLADELYILKHVNGRWIIQDALPVGK
ncbi:MAG: 2'-5' RNA ligase family protein [Saprospiraceae bacterium]|nr:2'-5' RNA ligase family protein [Saprospiraceae bacterium]